MISVEEALKRILSQAKPLETETMSLDQALGRYLAQDVIAARTHPPHDQSAMDGYAVRFKDVYEAPTALSVIGEAPAGRLFEGHVLPHQAVRIFTGGAVPKGADTIVIQENVERLDDGKIKVLKSAARPRVHVRKKGLDILNGHAVLHHGQKLGARHIGLVANAGHGSVSVYKKPRVALLFTGSELVEPGVECDPHQIVNSNAPMLAALVEEHGGIPISLGIAVDDPKAILERAQGFKDADICVTVGGASVGDHDLVQPVLKQAGLNVDFWKIAMRPGKPLIFGNFQGRPFIGLPGNPVSALVCSMLYLVPLLHKAQGADVKNHDYATAVTTTDLLENSGRQNYIRATLKRDADNTLTTTPLSIQDSSMLSVLARADALIMRPPYAGACPAGTSVPIIKL